MPITPEETLCEEDGTLIDESATGIGPAENVLVTARPTPAPENSTLTVVAEAARAGLSFGTKCAGRELPFALFDLAIALPLTGDSVRPVGEKSLDIGAIHPAAPL